MEREEEEEYEEPLYFGRQVNPVIRKNQLSPPRKPIYNPKNRQSRNRTPEPRKPFKRDQAPEPKSVTNQDIDKMIKDEGIQNKFQSESSKEKALKGQKDYGFDAWNVLKDTEVKISWDAFLRMSPEAQHQVKDGIGKNKPAFIPHDLNTIENKGTSITSAYTNSYIGQYSMEFIINSGARPSIISKSEIDRMGWNISEATTTMLIITNGTSTVPLG